MTTNRSMRSGNQIRYARTVGLTSAIGYGASISAGVGIYVLLGPLIRESNAGITAYAYFLTLLIAILIILTVAERVSVLPIQHGVYGLSRSATQLSLPFFTGWLMWGGLACLSGLLGWGIAVYAQILVNLFAPEEAMQIAWLAPAVTALAIGSILLSGQPYWQRYVVVVFIGAAFAAIAATRGLVILSPASSGALRTPARNILDIAVMVAASFWGIHFVLSVRNQMRRPTRTLLPALLVSAGIRTVLGIAAALALVWFPGDPLTTNAPLYDIVSLPGLLQEGLGQVAYGLLGLILCVFALRQSVDQTKELTGAMRRDGYLPSGAVLPGALARIDFLHVLFGAIAVLGVALLSSTKLIELAAVGFLFALALALLPALISSKDGLPENRRPKLPFHPLFPGLTVAICMLLPLVTMGSAGMYWLAWVAAGAAVYMLYARRQAIEVRRDVVVVETEPVSAAHAGAPASPRFRVLIVADDPAQTPYLIRTGASLARPHDGEILVLKALSIPQYISDTVRRQTAEDELEGLRTQIDEIGIEDVPAVPMVRLASRPASGILDTAFEENASLLLIGWRGENWEESRTPDPLLNSIVRYSPCTVAILRGAAQSLQRVVVFTAGGPNAAAALPLAEQLAGEDGGVVELVTVTSGMETAEAQRQLERTLTSASDAQQIHARLVDAGTVEAGVLATARDFDLLLLGMSQEDVSTRDFFGGLSTKLAFNSETPSILVHGQQHLRNLGLLRLQDSLRDALPNLTEQERGTVSQSMRESAVPTIDFYVLIVLASAIATLGLLQSSTAVIIGAMLVAPLMSPILATGMAIVLGETYTLRLSVEATVKGVTVAILVGIVITMLSPFAEATSEILARTQPTILDLMVALASGAAAGYAICRKEVAAALPGVAISAALVPPLCVVGYGIGTSQFEIATGSLILFLTNLVAIIVAGAVVFLALGFHPPRSGRGEFRRNLWVSGVSLAAVFVILMIATWFTVKDANARRAVEEVFRQDMVARSAVIDKLSVDRQNGGYRVTATVFTDMGQPMSSGDIARLQADLAGAVDGPVVVNLTVVSAFGSDLTRAADLRELEEYFYAAVEDADVSVTGLGLDFREDGIVVDTTLVTYAESALGQDLLDEWQKTMTEIAGQPVVLEVTVVQGQRTTYASTPTPIPAAQPVVTAAP